MNSAGKLVILLAFFRTFCSGISMVLALISDVVFLSSGFWSIVRNWLERFS